MEKGKGNEEEYKPGHQHDSHHKCGKRERFEIKCINRLKELGLQNVFKTSKSNDDGGDIVADLNNTKYVFQCKHHAKK